MSKKQINYILGEEVFQFTLDEISLSLNVPKQFIIEIIEEGIINVQTNEDADLLFDPIAYSLIRKVTQLHRDLNINVPGAALVLELLKEIDRLQRLLNK